MDFCSGLVAVFFFLDVISIQAADDSSKEDSNKIQLHSRVANKSLHQLSSNFSIVQNRNSFSELKKSENIKILFPDSFVLQSFNITSSNHDRSFIIDEPSISYIKPNTKLPPRFMQSSSTPLPYIHVTPASNVPILSTSPPTDNDFTTSRTRIRIYFPDSPFFIKLKQGLETMSPIKTMSKYMCDKYNREIIEKNSLENLSSDVNKKKSSRETLADNSVSEPELNILDDDANITSTSLENSSTADDISDSTNLPHTMYGGDSAHILEFPHMVALGRNSSNFILMCGGTLISHTWVLTAAHCTHGRDGGVTHAKLGVTSLSEQGIAEILNTIRHPNYKPPDLYNDIALARLKNAVKFNFSVRPACLYQRDTVSEKAWVSGWGITMKDGTASDILQKAELDLVDNESCKGWNNVFLRIPQGITPNMICAGDVTGNGTKDTCQGDSGGPLQLIPPDDNESSLHHVLGVTSFGSGCGLNVPGVYTRVSHYLKWIEDIVWSQEE